MAKKDPLMEEFAPLLVVRRRMWLARILHWTKWGIWAGLIWMLMILLLARMIPMLYAGGIAFGGAGILLMIAAGVGLAKKPSWEESARQADRCGLQERVITAWRLRDQEDPLILLQRADAVAALRQLSPQLKKKMPLSFSSRKELSLWGLALVIVIGLILLPNPMAEIALEKQAIRQALTKQEEQIEEELEKLEEETALPAEKKEEIKKVLEELTQELKNSKSIEEGIEALAKGEEKLEKLKREAEAESEAAHNLAKILAEEPAIQKLAQAQAEGNAEARKKALEEAKKALDKLSEEEKKALAAKLKQAAAEWEEISSQSSQEVAQKLNEAAKSLATDATQATNQLGQAMQAASQAMGEQGVTSQQISQAMQRVENMKVALVQAGQNPSVASQLPGNPSGGGYSQDLGQENHSDANSGNASSSGSSSEGGSGSGSDSGTGTSQGKGAGSGEGNRDLVNVPAERLAGGGPKESSGGPLGKGIEEIEQAGPGADFLGVSSPYADVYAEYAKEARQAVDRGDFPPLFEQLILEYFSSIEPQ